MRNGMTSSAAAVEEIYASFEKYLDFLRRALYPAPRGLRDLTDLHILKKTLHAQSLYLSDELIQKCWTYERELLDFWNWAMAERNSEAGQAAIRYRLDREIPTYLSRIRVDINAFIVPQGHD
jgi:hypothetical protein